MTNKEFIELQEVIEDLLCIDESKLDKESARIPKLYATILNKYSWELSKYKELLIARDSKKSEMYEFLLTKDNRAWERRDLEHLMLTKSPEYKQLCLDCSRYEVYVNYLEKALTRVNGMSYDIKNMMEFKKFITGEK